MPEKVPNQEIEETARPDVLPVTPAIAKDDDPLWLSYKAGGAQTRADSRLD